MPPENPELNLAQSFVEETNCALYLTGKAGTGKTTFLKNLRNQTDNAWWSPPPPVWLRSTPVA